MIRPERGDWTLLTGATGFLGSYLLRDFLAAGRRVAVLARPDGATSPERRITALLDRFQGEFGTPLAPPRILHGDLSQPGLGLDAESRSWIAEHCDRMVHCAASLVFHAKGDEPYRSNVDGTRHALRLCEQAGIEEFHHVSTAYVCGRRGGRILESDLECGQEFANDYERSKFVAEVLVHGSSVRRRAIHRASVIVGDSRTGFTSSRDGFYAFLAFARLIGDQDKGEILRWLGLGAEDGLNLVPVDWVAAAMTELTARPARAGVVTYHLTNPTPVPARQLVEVASSRFAGGPQAPLHGIEQVMAVYRPYLGTHAEFDVANTLRDAPELPCPRLDADMLERLVAFASDREPDAASRTAPIEVALAIGEAGAVLDLSDPDAPRGVSAADADAARVRAACSAATLDRLVDGDLTVEDAVYAGLLFLEGEPARLDGAVRLVAAHLHARRGAAPRSAPAPVGGGR